MEVLKEIPLLNPELVTISKHLNEGGQAEVFEGTYNSHKVTIKKFRKTNENDFKEIYAYSKLKHSIMVEFYGYFIDVDKKLNIVLEYAEGDELTNLISDELLTEEHKFKIAESVASLLNYLKANYTLHRDLKPQNFIAKIISPNEIAIKIFDFGISKIANQTQITNTTTSGTISYSPPELISMESKISFKYDIWSYGLILSYLFSGEQPWGEINQMQIEFCLFKKKQFPIPKSIENANVRRLIELCTQINPEKRITPSGVLYLLDLIRKGEDICNENINLEEYF